MRGFSLVELLVALAVTGVVAGALFGLLHGQERLARAQSDGVTAAEALRLSAFVLSGELRLLQPDEDLARIAPESAAVRALRGLALVCGAAAGGALVRYRGARAPDPAKDSVLLLRADSAALPLPLAGAAPAPAACAAGPGERVELWALGEAALPVGSAALLFESGTYALTRGALRYRRGGSGRQPLTVEWLDDAASGLQALDAAGGPTLDPARASAIVVRAAVEVPGSARRYDARLLLALLNGAVQGGVP